MYLINGKIIYEKRPNKMLLLRRKILNLIIFYCMNVFSAFNRIWQARTLPENGQYVFIGVLIFLCWIM